MVFLLIGSHLISHLALRQSQSTIPSLHSLLFPVVYPKVLYLAYSFSLWIQLFLARWSQKIPSSIICTLMTPSCTSLSLLQNTNSSLSLETPTLSLTFSPGWIWTNYYFSIHQKLHFSLYRHKTTTSQIFWYNKLFSQQWYHPSRSARNRGFIFDFDMSFSDQINSVSKSCHFHIWDIRRILHLPLSTATDSSCLQQTWLLKFTILWHLTS